MKIITYHYIREHSNVYPHLKFLNIHDFEKQLEYFKNQFWFISRNDWDRFINWDTKIGDWIVLTFDDWLKDHSELVLPILQKWNLWGIFFVPSWIFKTNALLNVHKLHYLLSKYNPEFLLEKLKNILLSNKLNHSQFNPILLTRYYKAQTDIDSIKIIKWINYLSDFELQSQIINELFLILNEVDDNKDWYMNKNDVLKLVSNWNIIGGHSMTHRVLSNLNSEQEMKKEIKDSINYLTDNFSLDISLFSYPYWWETTYNDRVDRKLYNTWVKFSFTTEEGDIDSLNQFYQNWIYRLPRYDCNKFPYWACK